MLLAKRLFSIANWSTLREAAAWGNSPDAHNDGIEMQEFALARAAGVALSGAAGREGGQMCESASRCLRSVNLERPWGGAGEGAPTLYWSPSKNGERELKLSGSTRLRATIRAAVSP